MSDMLNMPPGPIDIASAWRGEEMAASADRWLVHLAPDEIAELEQAARSFLATTKEIGEITKEKFPLPKFGVRLTKLKETLMTSSLEITLIRAIKACPTDYSNLLVAEQAVRRAS
jgi:hypothetical protein